MSTNENTTDKYGRIDRVNARINLVLRGLKYGSVVLTVHDSRIVQIERIEKNRFDDLYLEDGEGI